MQAAGMMAAKDFDTKKDALLNHLKLRKALQGLRKAPLGHVGVVALAEVTVGVTILERCAQDGV